MSDEPAKTANADPASVKIATPDKKPHVGLSGKTMGTVAAVGVGSAAIVAALLFTKPWKR